MASITIDFPNMPQARLNRGLSNYGSYNPKLENGADNPKTRAEFAVDVLKEVVRGMIRQAERDEAQRQPVPVDPEMA